MALRAQSAMEYLMTYGWAIVAIAVAIGVLYSLGIFNVGSSGASGCTVIEGFSCTKPVLYSSGILTMGLGQIGGTKTITATGCTKNSTAPSVWEGTNTTVQSGKVANLTFYCPSVQSNKLGSVFSGTLWIKYTSSGGIGITTQEIAAVKIPIAAPGISCTTTCFALITVTNTNTVTATGSNFQQMITINPALYAQADANDLGNIRFYSSNAPANPANELYSWCESGCSSNGTSSAIFWVNTGSTSIAASGSMNINMTFMPASTEYDGAYAGEAPQLSSSYAQYDNGGSVFTNYQNFAGSSVPGGWSLSNPFPCSPSTINFNNGVNESGPACNGEFLNGPSATGTLDIDADWLSAIGGGGTGSGFMGYTGLGALVGGFGTQSTNSVQAVASTESGGYQVWVSLYQPLNQWSVETTSFLGAGAFMIVNLQLNYGPVYYTGNGPSTGGSYFTVTLDNYHGKVTANVHWIRTRTTPPGDVMPSVSIGSFA